MASLPLATALAVMASLALATADVVTPLYKDPSQSVAARTTDLLSRMTLDEKIAQTLQPWSVEIHIVAKQAVDDAAAKQAEEEAAGSEGALAKRAVDERAAKLANEEAAATAAKAAVVRVVRVVSGRRERARCIVSRRLRPLPRSSHSSHTPATRDT